MTAPATGAGAAPAAAPLAPAPLACRVCGGDDAEPVGVGANFADPADPASYLVLRCGGCELLYLDPHPAPAAAGAALPDAQAADEARALRAPLPGVPAGARVLAAACGARWPAPPPGGWEVDPGALEGAAAGGYDAVLFPGSLERCADPVGALERAGRALRPGGRVVVRAANAGGAAARLLAGRHWAGYEFPRRLHLFSEATLRAAAARAGLRVERLTARADGRAWARSLGHLRADLGGRPRVAGGSAGARRSGARPAGPALVALGAALDALPALVGRGGRLEAVLRPAGRAP
jgi:SAM-dependent methyltransferase